MKYYLKGESIDEAIENQSAIWTDKEIIGGETVAEEGDFFIQIKVEKVKKVKLRRLTKLIFEETK